MYYNQELGLCIEFGPVRVDSVRRGGGGPPPWIKSPLRRFTPSWTSTRVTCDCLLPFVHPLLSLPIATLSTCIFDSHTLSQQDSLHVVSTHHPTRPTLDPLLRSNAPLDSFIAPLTFAADAKDQTIFAGSFGTEGLGVGCRHSLLLDRRKVGGTVEASLRRVLCLVDKFSC